MIPTRAAIKHNFLKNTIVRLDFQGVLDAEMGNILVSIKPYAKAHGFNRYQEKVATQIDVAVAVTNTNQQPSATPNKVRSQTIYSFINESNGLLLEVSSSFICLTIASARYMPFETYSMIIPDIEKMYRETIDFFTPVRLGLRKINECLLKDKSLINKYFEEKYFGFFDGIENADTKLSKRLDVFSVDYHNVNLACNIIQGKSVNEILYNVQLDIDTYISGSDIGVDTAKDDELKTMNDIIFSIFSCALTEEMGSALMSSGVFPIEEILGVEANE